MHDYQACGYDGFTTGQSFASCFYPSNWDPLSQARILQGQYLWLHEPAKILHRDASYISRMELSPEILPQNFPKVAQENLDSINHGAYANSECYIPGTPCVRLAPAMPMQVHNLFTADITDTICLTSATSIVALKDTFGKDHLCQETILSLEKLNLACIEERLLVGHLVSSRCMTV